MFGCAGEGTKADGLNNSNYLNNLNDLLLSHGMEPLDDATTARFDAYLELLLKWNRRLNLTAIRSPEEILERHFIESIFCARHLPAGITTLLDYGSGGGFPGIPIACCRPEIAVTLAESQGKKSVFLREVVRGLGLPTTVFGGRCETLAPESFAAVAMRAVDNMAAAVKVADSLIAPSGWLVLLIGAADADAYRMELPGHEWLSPLKVPSSDHGVLLLGQRSLVDH